MHNPENFKNPEKFNPERFLDENGRFQTDVRVCPFSVGLTLKLRQFLRPQAPIGNKNYHRNF